MESRKTIASRRAMRSSLLKSGQTSSTRKKRRAPVCCRSLTILTRARPGRRFRMILLARIMRAGTGLGCGDPYPGKDSDQPNDEIERDGLADELSGKQSRGDRVYGHGGRDSGRGGSLKGPNPQHERERASSHSQIDSGDPLRRPKAREAGNAARKRRDQDQRRGAGSHTDRQERKRAGPTNERTRPDVVEGHA